MKLIQQLSGTIVGQTERVAMVALLAALAILAIYAGLSVVPDPCSTDLAITPPSIDVEHVADNDSLTLWTRGDAHVRSMTTELSVTVIDNQTGAATTLIWYNATTMPDLDASPNLTVSESELSFDLDPRDEFVVTWRGYEVPPHCPGRGGPYESVLFHDTVANGTDDGEADGNSR